MTQQQFTYTAGTARRSDPQTSHDAAANITTKLAGRRRECLELIRRNPGICGSEIEARNPQLRKRIRELERLGLIAECGERKSAASGYRGKCWIVAGMRPAEITASEPEPEPGPEQ